MRVYALKSPFSETIRLCSTFDTQEKLIALNWEPIGFIKCRHHFLPHKLKYDEFLDISPEMFSQLNDQGNQNK